MEKRNYIAAVLLLFGFLVTPLELLSQSRPMVTRMTLSKMDVLSRAAHFESAIVDASRKEGVDPKILWTVAFNETRFRPWLTSPKNAQGLMQFMPATASRFGLANPYEPNASIHAAARYLKYLGRLFNWRLDSILAAYNSGEGTVAAYLSGRTVRSNGNLINPSGRQTSGGVPPYRETLNYVAQGLKVYRWLETLSRFRGVSKETKSSATTVTEPLKRDASKAGVISEAAATFVLYEPRTGKRFFVTGNTRRELNPIDQDGPVVISPGLHSVQIQNARSTFAGVVRR